MGKSCCHCCTSTAVVYGVLLVAIILACLGAAFKPLFKKLYDDKLKDRLILKKNSESYNNWVQPPVPLYMEYYIFNYTNVEYILNGSIPDIVQLGPYVYREMRLNYVIEENDDEITYLQNYTYIYDANRSCESCSEYDTIHTPNIALWTVMNLLHSANVTTNSSTSKKIIIGVIGGLLNRLNVTTFHQLSTYKLIWGYQDKFLEYLNKHREEMEQFMTVLGVHLPPINPFVALQHNGTSEGSFIGNVTLKTGKENIDDIQRIVGWRGLNKSPFWANKYGEMINGTDGTHFRPFLDKSDDSLLYVFISDAYRSLYLTYETDQIHQDISAYRYILTADVFANETQNPDNNAFCIGKCWKSGLLPVGQCLEGDPPVFFSSPHFYQGDPSLVEDINGMKPNKTLHETYIDVEPVTGQTLSVHKRLQINLLANIVPLVKITEHLRNNETFLPIFYLDENTLIDKKNADKFKHEVVRPKVILKWTRYGLYILGGVLFIGALIALIVIKKRASKYTLL